MTLVPVTIREMTADDRAIWARLRCALWPEDSEAGHARWIDGIVAAGDWGFVVEAGGEAVGFAEVSMRKYANGCESAPVPFLEGIWVREDFRRQGVGTRLLKHAEMVLAGRGFREMGSDALLDNRASHSAHAAWGFSETERVVYFRKIIAR